jgi:N-acetylmuramoyl-L-alanine amidase
MFLGSILLGIALSMSVSNDIQNLDEITEMKKYVGTGVPMYAVEEEIEYETEPTTEYVECSEPVVYDTNYISEDDINLIALITMAEAEAEPVEGQRLVIDTILNRVDSEIFPNTVYEVIYQENQFECVWNGRVDRCYVRDDIYQLVLEELSYRYDNNVIFFRTEYYSEYGVPMFQVGNHFFSSYY